MKYPDRLVITSVAAKSSKFAKAGERSWLYLSPEAGGWWQWGPEKWAYRFDENDTRLKDAIASAPHVGPWWNYPDPESIEVKKVPVIVEIFVR